MPTAATATGTEQACAQTLRCHDGQISGWQETRWDKHKLYAAMDWVLERQPFIEKKLAQRHLSAGGRVFYDLSSSNRHP